MKELGLFVLVVARLFWLASPSILPLRQRLRKQKSARSNGHVGRNDLIAEMVTHERRNEPRLIDYSTASMHSHYARTGEWPTTASGPVIDNLNEKWLNVDQTLRLGLRTLERGDSLARLLDRERGVRNLGNLPPLTEEQIVAWARALQETERQRRDG